MKLLKMFKEMSSTAQALAGLVGFAIMIVTAVGFVTVHRVDAVAEDLGGRIAMNAQRIDKKILRDDETYFMRKLQEMREQHMDEDGRWLPDTKQTTKDSYLYFQRQLKRVQDELKKYNPEE